MEEIFKENADEITVEETVETTETAKRTWKEWFSTDESVRIVYLIFGFFAIILLMIFLQFSTKAICCGDWDGYYHIRWSSLLWESFKSGHWLPDFTWLPLTVLNPQDYADHHFLFHLLQIPFLWFFEPVLAAKISTVCYGSLAIFSVYWLLFRYRVDYLLLWLGAILTCANPFFYRMNMGKAPPLTIIFTIIGIYLLFERKYIWLLPLMFLFVWTYSLFPLLLGATVIWVIIIAWNERKFEWKPFGYATGGMILGNIINPYFPHNLTLLAEHFFTKFKVDDFVVSVGGEWYPYSSFDILTHFPIAMIAMLIGYILFAPRNGKLPEKATFFLMFVTTLLVLQFRSKRFAEYFPPFAILFAAFSWQAFMQPRVSQLPDEFKREIEPLLDKDKRSEKQEWIFYFKQATPWVLGGLLVIVMFYSFIGIDTTVWGNESWRNTVGLRWFFNIKQVGLKTDIGNNDANDRYQRATSWANENIPEGERIFNSNWDDFPKLFFYDTKHAYVYGLDPNYLYSQNPDLYKLLNEITSGKIKDPAPEIRGKFGANYIFADAKENEDLVTNCLESGWCEMAYEDDEARILKIRDQKGDAPKDTTEDDKPPTPEELKQLDEEEKAANNANQNTEDEVNVEEQENVEQK